MRYIIAYYNSPDWLFVTTKKSPSGKEIYHYTGRIDNARRFTSRKEAKQFKASEEIIMSLKEAIILSVLNQ